MMKQELQYFGHLIQRANSLGKTDAGKDWGEEVKGAAEDEMVGWYHWLNGHEFEQALGHGEGEESLVCCSMGSQRLSDWTTRSPGKSSPLFISFTCIVADGFPGAQFHRIQSERCSLELEEPSPAWEMEPALLPWLESHFLQPYPILDFQ